MTKNILEGIATIISKLNLPYDRTFPSVIWNKENGKYQIAMENRLYTVPNALGTDLSIGTLVWVKIPCGKLREMHICGIRYKD